jgi:hypothetical protein
MSDSDLVHISKRSGEFSKNYGKFWGGIIHLSHVNAATGRGPFLWGALVTIGVGVLGFALRHALPAVFG